MGLCSDSTFEAQNIYVHMVTDIKLLALQPALRGGGGGLHTFITRFWWVWAVFIRRCQVRPKQVLFDSVIDHFLYNPTGKIKIKSGIKLEQHALSIQSQTNIFEWRLIDWLICYEIYSDAFPTAKLFNFFVVCVYNNFLMQFPLFKNFQTKHVTLCGLGWLES